MRMHLRSEEIEIGADSLCARRGNERDRRNLWDTREIQETGTGFNLQIIKLGCAFLFLILNLLN